MAGDRLPLQLGLINANSQDLNQRGSRSTTMELLMSYQKASILIVDDIPDNLRLLSEMLTREKFQVRKAINGKMALQSIEQLPPDLILLDIQMPEMNGYEVCIHLKSQQSTRTIPIIFISAINDVFDKVKAFSLGAVDYITKPFDIAEVLARVNNQIQVKSLQKDLENRNKDLNQAITDLEIALIEGCRLRTELERSNKELKAANRKLGEIAIIDALTQIPNRRRFDEYLDESWQYCLENKEPLSLILADIDFFKLYNDHYGHQKGDRCLYAVAQAVQNSTILARDLAARYGGEEIAVILPSANINNAKVVAERILEDVRALNIEHVASKIKDTISLSLGVQSIMPTPAKTIGNLVIECDQALYHAKASGRDRLSLYSEALTAKSHN